MSTALRTTLAATALALAAPAADAAAQRVTDVRGGVVLISRIGGKCMDAEGARTSNDTRVIGYPCSGAANQMFQFTSDGRIKRGGKCLVIQGGQARDEAPIVLFTCNGTPNEYWTMSGGRITSNMDANMCMDLKGGNWGNVPFMNQPIILYRCNGQDNQNWRWGALLSRSAVSGGNEVASGGVGRIEPIRGLGAQIVAAGGGNLVGNNGNTIVAAGGGNIVAAGGGNIVAAGGGN